VYQTLLYEYRAPSCFAATTTTIDRTSDDVGFFQFGPEIICYGRNQSGVTTDLAGAGHYHASKAVHHDGPTIQLPFSFAEVIDSLRLEHYAVLDREHLVYELAEVSSRGNSLR